MILGRYAPATIVGERVADDQRVRTGWTISTSNLHGSKAMTKLGAKVSALAKVLPAAKRNRLDLVRFLIRRPALLAAVGGYEAGLLLSSRADNRTKALASVKTSSLVGCPY